MSQENCPPVLGNTGKSECLNEADIIKHMMLDEKYDSTGALKTRLLSDMQDKTYVQAQTAATTAPADRLYPLLDFEQVENLRDDPRFQEFNSGRKQFVKDGYKNFTGFMPNAPREWEAKLNQNRCAQFGVWPLDDSNQIHYKKQADLTKGAPILVDQGSFYAKYVEPTDTEVGGIMLTFQWKRSEKDSDIGILGGLNYDSEDLAGLVDGQAAFSNILTTGFRVTLTETCFGQPITGVVLGDLTLNEISPTPADITANIASWTETDPGVSGVYDLVFTVPESSNDVLRLTIALAGLDFSSVDSGNNDISIP